MSSTSSGSSGSSTQIASTYRLDFGLYKIFVGLFGDCALVNTILGIHYSWHSMPPFLQPSPLYFAINIAEYMVSPRPPCFAIQHTILVITISCKG